MLPAAIKATWSTYKPVPTRNVLQLVLEVPLEQQEQVFRCLGFPVSGKETWVGVALLDIEKVQEKPKKPFHELSRAQQAGILCADERFREWISEGRGECSEEDAAHSVRQYCGVLSRADLDMPPANRLWDALVSRYLQATGQMAEQR